MISNERWTASTQGQCITRGRICVRNTHDPNSCFFITSCLFVLHDDPNSHWRPHVQITVCVCICYKLHRHTCTRLDKSLFNIDVPQSPQGFWYVARSIHVDGYTLLQTNSSEIVSVCDNKYTQHIKTDYESTKNKTTTTNNNFNCIHVRNKYILNQNRIKFTVWIYKIQLSVNFCKTISERSQTLSSRKSKWLKLKPLEHTPNVVINPPKRTKLVKLGLKSLLRFKITKCRWIYGLW